MPVLREQIGTSAILRTFRSLIDQAPDRPIVQHNGVMWTRQDLAAEVDRVAEAVCRAGIGSGDVIGFLGDNEPAFFATLFAALRLNAIFCPMPAMAKDVELAQIVFESDVRAIVCGSRHIHQVESLHTSGESDLALVAHNGGGGAGSCYEIVRNCIKSQSRAHRSRAQLSAAILMHTSGTSGRAKGVCLTDGNLMASVQETIRIYSLDDRDIAYGCCPLFHAAGLNTLALPVLMAGAPLHLENKFDPVKFVGAVAEKGITVSLLVPTMLHRLAKEKTFASSDISSLRQIMFGGAPPDLSTLKLFIERGIEITHGYGMTESTSAVLTLASDYAVQKIGSCGRPGKTTEIKLITANGTVVDRPNVHGEIWLRGPTISPGYWKAADGGKDVYTPDGWFRTGDIGTFDEEGFYYIRDRLKDIIISGGENIAASEVEQCLRQHPAVQEVAVIGCPHPEWGEAVVACVTVQDNAEIDLEELCRHAATLLPRFKLPKAAHFMHRLPCTPSGKISKPELRKTFVGTFISDDTHSPVLKKSSEG